MSPLGAHPDLEHTVRSLDALEVASWSLTHMSRWAADDVAAVSHSLCSQLAGFLLAKTVLYFHHIEVMVPLLDSCSLPSGFPPQSIAQKSPSYHYHDSAIFLGVNFDSR